MELCCYAPPPPSIEVLFYIDLWTESFLTLMFYSYIIYNVAHVAGIASISLTS